MNLAVTVKQVCTYIFTSTDDRKTKTNSPRAVTVSWQNSYNKQDDL